MKIICLANSWKHGDLCFAGILDKERETWVRPLGMGTDGAIPERVQALDRGGIPKLLDVIDVPIGDPLPSPGQPENRQLLGGQWQIVRRLKPAETLLLLQDQSLSPETPLWGGAGSSLTAAEAHRARYSLTLIQPGSVRWEKKWSERTRGKIDVRAHFSHAGVRYNLSVTDPAWHDRMLDRRLPIGTFDHPDPTAAVFLTLSLGSEWRGRHWMLVAGVFSLEGRRRTA